MSDTPWPHFARAELACRCCGRMEMDRGFMAALERLRVICGFPFVVTSAYRCPDHNERVSSTGRDGPHTTGRAIDIAVNGDQTYRILKANFIGIAPAFTGIGISQSGSSRFIHLDNLTSPPRPNVWSYQ